VLTHRDPWLCSSLPILIGTEPQIILQEIPDTIDPVLMEVCHELIPEGGTCR
jgi:hypothetical protein